MKKITENPTYVACIQDYAMALSKSIHRKSTANMATMGNYQKLITNTNEAYVPEDTTISDSQILSKMSPRALKLAIQIIKELQFNNALWHFDHTKNRRDAKAIQELRDLGVLKPTEDTRIHYVNPFLIRKGNILAVTANTANITHKRKVRVDLIKPLTGKNIQLNPQDVVNYG